MKYCFLLVFLLIGFQLCLMKKVDACIFCLDTPPPEFKSKTPEIRVEEEDPNDVGTGFIINDQEALLMMENLRLKKEKEHLIELVKRLREKLQKMGME